MSRSSTNRDLILSSARRLFYTRGFAHTSLADLASDSGVNKGNFYYHFPSKDDVLRAVIEARLADIDAALARWQRDFPEPRERLARFLQMITSERDALVTHGCPTGSLLSELGKREELLFGEARAIMERYIVFLTTQLEALGLSEPRQRALHLMARVQGAILLAQTYADAALLDREIAQAMQWLDDLDPHPQGALP